MLVLTLFLFAGSLKGLPYYFSDEGKERVECLTDYKV